MNTWTPQIPILYWTLNCTLYWNHTTKRLAELTFYLRNNPFLNSCNSILYNVLNNNLTLQYIPHSTLYCSLHCTLYLTLKSIQTPEWLAEVALSPRNTFLASFSTCLLNILLWRVLFTQVYTADYILLTTLLYTVLYTIFHIVMYKEFKVVCLLFHKHYPYCLLNYVLLTIMYTVLYC